MKVLFALSSVLALGIGIGILASKGPVDRKLEITGGRTAIAFYGSILQADGLKLDVQSTGGPDTTSGEPSVGFTITQSNFRYSLLNGHLEQFDGGAVRQIGGFRILGNRGSIDAMQFSVATTPSGKNQLQLLANNGKETYPAFDLSSPRGNYDVKQSQIVIWGMDMLLTAKGAQALGHPEWTGRLFGTLSVFGDSKTIDRDEDIYVDNGGAAPASPQQGLDVALYNVDSLVSVGRTGTYPNGVNGLSLRTTSCNVGTVNIPWDAPMQVNHPVIAMNVFRLKDGHFEQIGWSWLKHGFLATNSNGCGTCQNPGTSALLGVNCSDTYGTGNNSDRFYLGERKEVNAFTGVWTCQNSYFSNYLPDCVRRNNGTGLDAVAHRLRVLDADLGNSGAQYYYEAYYICQNDINKYNNIASRLASTTWSGSQWNFQTLDSQQTPGPAIFRWGDMNSTAAPRTEGDVIVAVSVTSLGGGMYHYEYALYNLDLDRQIREFRVPLPAGANVQHMGFHDIDDVTTNEWTPSVGSNALIWTSPVFGSSTANPLMYASLFNFWFDSNIPPAIGSTRLTLFKPGTGTELTASTKAPMILQPPKSFELDNAAVLSGGLSSLAASDDERLNLRLAPTGFRGGGGIITTNTAPSASVAGITIGVETSNAQQANDSLQKLELWNWATSQWELIDSRPTTTGDTLNFFSVTSNPSRFVSSGNFQVKARLYHSLSGGSVNRWQMSVDEIGMSFN